MSLRDDLGRRRLYYDGACGTYLQSKGLSIGEIPEKRNLDDPEQIVEMHRAYLRAGADIILTHTFGANRFKLKESGLSVEEIVARAVRNATRAVEEEGRGYIALDIGPLGKILEPVGDLPFEEAYDCFKEIVVAGREGVDLISIETMSDPYEIKAALLAAKEHSDLPVFVTAAFQGDGHTLTGCSAEAFAELAISLGAEALGMNCSVGPAEALPLIRRLLNASTIPVIASPNAGLPSIEKDECSYDIDAQTFAEYMEDFAKEGVGILGGCCGTLPAYIEKTVACTQKIPLHPPKGRSRSAASSAIGVVDFDESPRMIGERLNPTGKKELRRALLEKDYSAALAVALKQEEEGAHLLDVNVGAPGVDEKETLPALIRELQGVTDLPLVIDTADAVAMERSARIYNGRPVLNSVSGKKEVMDAVLPIVSRYGALCVALLLDDEGIPETAEKRMAIAERILKEGTRYGLSEADFLFDPLAMTISSRPDGAEICLKTLKYLSDRGLRSVLGISNISFGLPHREALNAHFYSMALASGLNAGIVDPGSPEITKAYRSAMALLGRDRNFDALLEGEGDLETPLPSTSPLNLAYAIEKGLRREAASLTEQLLEKTDPLAILDNHLVPALDKVGKAYEAKLLFLPQLLRAADAAASAFEVIRTHMEKSGSFAQNKGRILLATVKGDIHDIGKNIAKALLENYGFDILDLGKDVEPARIVETARRENIALIGLSALMTTTLPFMKESIRLIRRDLPEAKIMVGGAVLTKDYAEQIGADAFCPDAMASVRFAEDLFNA